MQAFNLFLIPSPVVYRASRSGNCAIGFLLHYVVASQQPNNPGSLTQSCSQLQWHTLYPNDYTHNIHRVYAKLFVEDF